MSLDDYPWETTESVVVDGIYNPNHLTPSRGWDALGCWYYTGSNGAFHDSEADSQFQCDANNNGNMELRRICPCLTDNTDDEEGRIHYRY